MAGLRHYRYFLEVFDAVRILNSHSFDKQSKLLSRSIRHRRNLTNVWNVPMGQTTKNHHAVFPSALVERPHSDDLSRVCHRARPTATNYWVGRIQGGSSRKRLIGKCKQVEHNEDDRRELQERSGRQDTARRYTPRKPVTEGWTNADLPVTRRGIVLDPFAGTATTGEVAIKLGRDFIGIELYDEYASIAEQRCREAAVLRSRYESGRESKLNVFSCERNDQLGGSPCDPPNNREAQHEPIAPTSRSSLPHSI